MLQASWPKYLSDPLQCFTITKHQCWLASVNLHCLLRSVSLEQIYRQTRSAFLYMNNRQCWLNSLYHMGATLKSALKFNSQNIDTLKRANTQISCEIVKSAKNTCNIFCRFSYVTADLDVFIHQWIQRKIILARNISPIFQELRKNLIWKNQFHQARAADTSPKIQNYFKKFTNYFSKLIFSEP